ncbi:hypothetical protein PV326_014438, partial [Microctonus aethiopoides]
METTNLKTKPMGDGAPTGVPDPQLLTPSANDSLQSGQTSQSGHSGTIVPMDMSAGQAGSDTTGPPNPKDNGKKKNRCGAAKKRARKAKVERELGLAPRVDATSNVSAPQPGDSLVGSNDCGRETGDKDGSAPINLKRRRNETVTPPEIRKWVKKNRGAQPSSFREAVLAGRRLAIVPVSYPGRSLRRILWLTCTDDVAKEWLRSTVSSIKPWGGACLQVLDKERIPKLKKMMAIFRDTNEGEAAIFKRLERGNPGLNTEMWK